MTLQTNVDFPNGELSIEELEAIAAGWPGWVHSAWHGIERAASAVYNVAQGPVGQTLVTVAGLVILASTASDLNKLSASFKQN
jgi:hypothetical protein